jgi:hypothetical protein
LVHAAKSLGQSGASDQIDMHFLRCVGNQFAGCLEYLMPAFTEQANEFRTNCAAGTDNKRFSHEVLQKK